MLRGHCLPNDLIKAGLFLIGLFALLPEFAFAVIQEGSGIVTTTTPFCGDVLDNALTYTPELIARIQEILGADRTVTPGQWKALELAHFSGRGEVGLDGVNPAKADNFTPKQFMRKVRILLEAGFLTSEIRALLAAGSLE